MSLIATDKYYAVVGLGLTGLSVARYLGKTGQRFCVLDSRAQPPGYEELRTHFPDVRVHLGEFDETILKNARAVVLSPGVSRETPAIASAIDHGVPITSDVELFLQTVQAPVVGVTGSNGKSTVVTLLGEVAKSHNISVAVGGNIGIPILDLLADDIDLFVLELSSFQLENIRQANLQVSCVLNVSLDHLDRHKTMEGYFRAKQRIYFGSKNVVYNLDDRLTIPPLVKGVARAGFSLFGTREENETLYWYSPTDKMLMKGNKTLMPYGDMRVKGLHNIANALAVFAISEFIEIPPSAVVRVLCHFKGLPHRCEWIAEYKSTTFINDSKATNVGATEAAIAGLKDDFKYIYLIAGGDGKGADFSSLGDCIRQYVKALILIGKDGEKIAKEVSEGVEIYRAINMQSAVQLAAKLAGGQSDEKCLVLLSPACASFDMYDGYEARGRDFVEAVNGVCA